MSTNKLRHIRQHGIDDALISCVIILSMIFLAKDDGKIHTCTYQSYLLQFAISYERKLKIEMEITKIIFNLVLFLLINFLAQNSNVDIFF